MRMNHPRRRTHWSIGLMLVAACCLLVSGCGYSTKPLYNKSVRTVAVPIFKSKSFRRELEMRFTEALCKNIEYRTPYKIANEKNADTVLSGTIISVDEQVLTTRYQTSLPRESQVVITVDFTWKDARSGRVLVERKRFNRSATEIPQINERVTDAEQLAVERTAAAVVDQLQTDW